MKQRKNYIDSEELREQLKLYKESGSMSERLGEIFITLTDHILGHSNFRNYPVHLKEEMQGYALMLICRYIHNCDPSTRTARQCMNYCSTVVFNAYKQVLAQHYRRENAKRELMREQQLKFASEYGVNVREDEFEPYK